MIAHAHHPAISILHIMDEIERDARARQGFYPARIAKGNVTQAEADWQQAIAAAWTEDLRRVNDFRAAASMGRACQLQPPAHGISWSVRQSALLREITARNAHYPAAIAKGRLTAEQAAHRLACLHCLLEIYEDGLDWQASNNRRGNVVLAVTDPAERAARDEFNIMRDARKTRAAALLLPELPFVG